jgi:hypothetical protein
MRGALQIAAAVVIFFAGIVLAGAFVAGGWAQDTTTETVLETTTRVETTIETATQTVEQTTTREVVVPRPATTATTMPEESSTGDTPLWVWVLLAILAVALAVAIVLLFGRGRSAGIPDAERRRRLDGAVGSWTVQGWALENQSGDSAVLQRGGERMLVSVDPSGQITTRPLAG